VNSDLLQWVALVVNQNSVFLDGLLLATMGEVAVAEFLADFAGMAATLVESLGNVEDSTIGFTTSFNRLASLEAVKREVAADGNPTDGITFTDEDLVGVDLDLSTVSGDRGTAREMTTTFTRMNTTVAEGTRDVEGLPVLRTTLDSVLRDVPALVQNPGDYLSSTVAVVGIGAGLSITEPGLSIPKGFFFSFLRYARGACRQQCLQRAMQHQREVHRRSRVPSCGGRRCHTSSSFVLRARL